MSKYSKRPNKDDQNQLGLPREIELSFKRLHYLGISNINHKINRKMKFNIQPKNKSILTFQSFKFERTIYRLFQKCIVHTKLDIYMVINVISV